MNGEFVNGFFTAVPFTLIADLASVYSSLFSIQNLLTSSISEGSKVIPKPNSRGHYLHPWVLFLAPWASPGRSGEYKLVEDAFVLAKRKYWSFIYVPPNT
jgi:hypothetical protein